MPRGRKPSPPKKPDVLPAGASDFAAGDLEGSLDGGDDLGGGRDNPGLPARTDGIAELLEPERAAFLPPEINPNNLSKEKLDYCWARALGWNKTQAAAHAGFAGGASTASKLEDTAPIQNEIKRLETAFARKREPIPAPTNATEVLNRWWEIGNVNYTDAWDLSGDQPKLKRIRDMPPPLQRCIEKFIFDKDRNVVDVKFYDPVKGLEKISGYLGLRMSPDGPWSQGGSTPGEDDGGGDPDLPSEESGTKRTLTFEERRSANGDTIRRAILKS